MVDSVIQPRSKETRDNIQRTSDYDREQMAAYGFIYADGTYSDQREPRGATLVPRRPTVYHMWDPDQREWYHDVTGAEQDTGEDAARRFRQNAEQMVGGSLLPDRLPANVATAPSEPTLSAAAGSPSREAWLRAELAKEEAARASASAYIPLNPNPTKTDLYPTHSVAHSVAGVVTSNDPAATFQRPESVYFAGAGPAPSQDEVQAQMKRDADAARQRAVDNGETMVGGTNQSATGNLTVEGTATREESGAHGTITTGMDPRTGLHESAEVGTGAIATQGASNTTRPIGVASEVGAQAEGGQTGTGGNQPINPALAALNTTAPQDTKAVGPTAHQVEGSNQANRGNQPADTRAHGNLANDLRL